MNWQAFAVDGGSLSTMRLWGALHGEWSYCISYDSQFPELGYNATRRLRSAPHPFKITSDDDGSYTVGLKPGASKPDLSKHPAGTHVIIEGAKTFTEADKACSRLARGLQ